MALRHKMQWQYASPQPRASLIRSGAMPKRPKPPADKGETPGYKKEVGHRLTWIVEILIEANPGLTQTKLAERYNVVQSTWNKWMAGTRLPAVDRMAAFCNDCGATLDFIYSGIINRKMARELELHLYNRHPELALEELRPRPRPALVPRGAETERAEAKATQVV